VAISKNMEVRDQRLECETVLLPFGTTWLVLSPDQFRQALRQGQVFANSAQELQQPPTTEDRIADAAAMEALTGIPRTWFLEQARRGNIPHIRAGKYVRFRPCDVLETLDSHVRHTDKLSVAPKKRAVHQ